MLGDQAGQAMSTNVPNAPHRDKAPGNPARVLQGRVLHHSRTGPWRWGLWDPTETQRGPSLHIAFCHLQQVKLRHGSASRGGWGTRTASARTHQSRNRPGAVVPSAAPFLLLCLRSNVSPFFFLR